MSVAVNLDEKEAGLVTRQMLATNAAYYQAIIGEQHAANAYKSMANLREGRTEILSKASWVNLNAPLHGADSSQGQKAIWWGFLFFKKS